MSVLIKDMEMPTLYMTYKVRFTEGGDGKIIVGIANENSTAYRPIGEVIPVPPHGDLIDRDALIKDGWLCLHKEVVRMGGYAIHELPLKNPSIPVIIKAEEGV